MEKVFNKLVRDNIPSIMEKENEKPVIRILDDNEYKEELYKKLLEECNEVISSKSTTEVLEELADVYEILRAISTLEGSDISLVEEIANKKRIKKGSFEKRIYLEKSYKD